MYDLRHYNSHFFENIPIGIVVSSPTSIRIQHHYIRFIHYAQIREFGLQKKMQCKWSAIYDKHGTQHTVNTRRKCTVCEYRKRPTQLCCNPRSRPKFITLAVPYNYGSLGSTL